MIPHCDLKPGDILVSNEGRVKLVDFGIAGLVSARAPGGRFVRGRFIVVIQAEVPWPEIVDKGHSPLHPWSSCRLGRSDFSFHSEGNMMIKRFLVTLALLGLLASAPVSAQLTGQIGYAHITDDFDLGAIVGSFGMEFDVTDNFALVPEFRAGLGVRDDTVGGIKVELDHLLGVSNRFQFNTTENFYLFGSLSYVRYKLTAKVGSVSASDNSWEWGYGGGFGFRFNQNHGLDLSYERVDGVDVITAGWRFRF